MRASPIALAVGALAVTGFAPPAAAHTQRTAPGRHCVVWIAPITGRAPSKVSRVRCFARFSRALRVAQGRPPNGFPDPRTGVVPHAGTLISTDYDGGSFGTPTLMWTVSNTNGCNGGFQYSAANMPANWNDRVSSSRSAHGCASNIHFHNTNFGGAAITCTCATMGTMNNQTSSETWSQ